MISLLERHFQVDIIGDGTWKRRKGITRARLDLDNEAVLFFQELPSFDLYRIRCKILSILVDEGHPIRIIPFAIASS
jgi:hypothetical protein